MLRGSRRQESGEQQRAREAKVRVWHHSCKLALRAGGRCDWLGAAVPWASGTEAGALEGGDCPPGFSLDSSNPMRIPLKRTPNNRVLSSAPSQVTAAGS